MNDDLRNRDAGAGRCYGDAGPLVIMLIGRSALHLFVSRGY